MIKKFFLSFLGSMAAIWFTFILLFVLAICIVAAGVASMGSGMKTVATTDVKKGSVLVVDVAGAINERKTAPSLTDALQGEIKGGMNLSQTISSIYRAAHDARISGIYLNCEGCSGGIASLQEIQEALTYFKGQPDKWIMSYGDNYGSGDYYIASAANEIWLNPYGGVDVHGLSATTMFYTGLLEKLGVEMQIFRVGTFKSAVEPFFLKEISPASRLQQESYMGSIWSHMAGDIAAARGVELATVNAWADEFTMTLAADSVKALGVVTDLGYRHQAHERLAELADKEEYDEIDRLSVSEYAKAFDASDFSYLPGVESPKKDTKTIAVLYATGEISDAGTEGIIGNETVKQINELADKADDEKLAGLILRVNSPGGSAFASEQIWEALEQFKEKTGLPFYASMSDVAASGGYYISCGADKIYAQPTTLTGSIGIFGMMPQIKGLLNKHLGITTSTVQTNRNGAFPSTFEPMTSEQLAKMQAHVERGYDLFTSRCAQGRHTTQDSIKAIAEGRVWSGAQALEIGLVDHLGTLRDAIAGMASDLELASYKVKEFPESESEWWETLMTMSELEGASLPAEALRLADQQRALRAIERLKDAPTIHCRMETVVIE